LTFLNSINILGKDYSEFKKSKNGAEFEINQEALLLDKEFENFSNYLYLNYSFKHLINCYNDYFVLISNEIKNQGGSEHNTFLRNAPNSY
jgi:sensor histidine kinase YesM